MDCALITYIYQDAKRYFPELLCSVKAQTFNEFDFIVFSDGVSDDEINWFGLKHKFIPINGTPTEIRIKSLPIISDSNYKKIVFADADDTLSHNRMEVSNKLLETYSIICNDLNIIDENGTLKKKSIWEKRLNNLFTFNDNFLIDKNILGFGNSALRGELLRFKINLPLTNILATDWYVFYQLLKLSGKTACFSSDLHTNYRQHSFNTAGIRPFSKERIIYALEVKKKHYKALLEENYSIFLEKICKLEKISGNPKIVLRGKKPQHLFWWEETNFLK